MAQSTGLRFFLFEADGTLRRLPKQTVDGMVRGEDRMTSMPVSASALPRPGSCSTKAHPPSCSRSRAAGGSSTPKAGHWPAF